MQVNGINFQTSKYSHVVNIIHMQLPMIICDKVNFLQRHYSPPAKNNVKKQQQAVSKI